MQLIVYFISVVNNINMLKKHEIYKYLLNKECFKKFNFFVFCDNEGTYNYLFALDSVTFFITCTYQF